MIATRIFKQINVGKRPVLKPASGLLGAGGAPIQGCGKAEFEFKLGPLEIIKEAVVADIEDDALLGYDVLKGSERGAADILLSRNKIILNGVDIPCFQVGPAVDTRRVVVAETCTIPGLTEALVDVYVDRKYSDDDNKRAEYLVEPTGEFIGRYQLMMTSTLVDINKGTTCKVRVLNPFKKDTILRQDAEIATANMIEGIVSTVKEAEHEEEHDNLARIRRIHSAVNKTNDKSNFFEASERDVPEHLQSLYKRSTDGKSGHEKRVVAGLLVKYENTFSKAEWDIGLTDLAEHSINTGDAPPVKQRPRRVPLAYAEDEKKAIEDLLQKGVIRESTSPWASPIVLVKKKTGAIRPCVDYRRVNALVKPDGFPLPRVQDCLDAVAGASLFSSFDLTSGYFQIPLKPDDIPKSAFCCKYGHFEMTRMPFGLNNAASTFQRTMEIALQGLQWVTCLVYIDDIIVYGDDFEQHIQRVEQVLERIKTAGLKLRPDKCGMLQTSVVFLGHVVSKEGVLPDPSNIIKIADWPRPVNAKQVKQFVATGSYYRRFVRDFAKIARPLTDLTKKDSAFIWTDTCEEAFRRIKKTLMGPDIMGYPMNEGGLFYLDTDASGTGIGAVLSQMQAGRERVIAYASRGMNKAERNYCITEQELLAVIYFIQYFRQYLLGRHFVVRSDHQALVWLFKLKEPSGKIARWIEILAPYDFEIQYRPGKSQGHCDALSRCDSPRDCTCSEVDTSEPLKCGPCNKCNRRAEMMMLAEAPAAEEKIEEQQSNESIGVSDVEAVRAVDHTPTPGTSKNVEASLNHPKQPDTWVGTDKLEKLMNCQASDPDVSFIMQKVKEGTKPNKSEMELRSPTARHYWVIWDNLEIVDGILYKVFKCSDGRADSMQIIVPQEVKRDVLFQMHDSITAGHMGVKKTKSKIIRHFYWYDMKQDISLYVKGCDICAADKKPQKTPRAPMGRLGAGAPWDVLAVDFAGPFPVTARGNRYVMVLTDHFSKYVEVIPVPNITAEECTSRIVNEVIARWGTPLAIHSDQGTSFESKVFQDLCKMLEVKKTRTSARNPRGNGQVERFNRTLLKMVRAYLTEQEEWDVNLGCITGAYRATPTETTGLSPNLLTIGREIRLPADLLFGHVEAKQVTTPNYCVYIQDLKDRMLKAHEIARNHLATNAKRSKEIYDAKLAFHRYEVGDVVWCLLETRKVGITPKLQRAYDGLFLITEKRSEINFTIQLGKDGQTRGVHHNKLKPYEGTNPPTWIKKAKKKLQSSC